ncbi:hypothetical protein MaudMau93_005695 [Microsporum audouinii]
MRNNLYPVHPQTDKLHAGAYEDSRVPIAQKPGLTLAESLRLMKNMKRTLIEPAQILGITAVPVADSKSDWTEDENNRKVVPTDSNVRIVDITEYEVNAGFAVPAMAGKKRDAPQDHYPTNAGRTDATAGEKLSTVLKRYGNPDAVVAQMLDQKVEGILLEHFIRVPWAVSVEKEALATSVKAGMHVVADRLISNDEADPTYTTEVLRCPTKIKGRPVCGIVDTGSEANVMSRELAVHLSLRIIPNPSCRINRRFRVQDAVYVVVDVLGIEVATPFLIVDAGNEQMIDDPRQTVVAPRLYRA